MGHIRGNEAYLETLFDVDIENDLRDAGVFDGEGIHDPPQQRTSTKILDKLDRILRLVKPTAARNGVQVESLSDTGESESTTIDTSWTNASISRFGDDADPSNQNASEDGASRKSVTIYCTSTCWQWRTSILRKVSDWMFPATPTSRWQKPSGTTRGRLLKIKIGSRVHRQWPKRSTSPTGSLSSQRRSIMKMVTEERNPGSTR